MQYRLTPIAAALAVAFIVPMSMAQAQTTDTPSSQVNATGNEALPDITVNADASKDGLPKERAGGQVAKGSRLGILGNVDNIDSPVSSTAYTSQLIEDQQAHSIGDVLKNDPIVTTTRGYGNYQESYMIRGFIANSDDLMFNGLYGVLPRQYLASEMVERVEVLYGASAFLNGAAPGNAGLGGTINIVPKRASSDPLTEVTLGYESGNAKYVNVDLGRRFGPEDRVGIRINAARHAGGTGISGEKTETNVFTLGADYRGNDFRLSADFGIQENNQTGIRPSVMLDSGLTAVPSAASASSNFAQPWSYSNERDIFGTVRGEWDLSDSTTAWAAFGAREGIEGSSLATPSVTNASTGAATMYVLDTARQQNVATGEVGIRTKFNTGSISHKTVVSASTYSLNDKVAYTWSNYLPTNIYSPTTYSQSDFSTVLYHGNDMSNPQTRTKVDLWSAVLSDTMGFYGDKVLLTLGVRQQYLKQNEFAYDTLISDSYRNQSATSPMAGVVFKVLKNLSLYGNYIQGLQQGEQVSSYIGATNGGALLAPYKATQKEVGIKYEIGGMALGAAFFTTEKPLQVMNATTKIVSLDGEQRNRGVELTAVGELIKGVRLLSGITFLDAKQENGSITSAATSNNGKYVIGAPKMRATAGVDYDIPGVSGLTVNGRATYVSTQYVDSANTLEVPSWVRYDIGARYLTEINGHLVTFRGSIENLANRNYWASAGGSSNAGYLVLGNPRTFSTSVSVAF